MTRLCQAGPVRIGPGEPLAIIAGPCVLESLELGMGIARTLSDACRGLGLSYIFKASFDKANRSSIRSPRGPGLERGLEWLAAIGRELGVPVTTDIHAEGQAGPVAEVVDILQIPAFLCRQTDLLVAAGEAAAARNRAVNVKKGQFLSPAEMAGPVRKLAESGCTNVMLTERGTFFGYHRLVNDFLGLGDLMELDVGAAHSNPDRQGGAPVFPARRGEGGVRGETPSLSALSTQYSARSSPPVCFDCTHSTQLPGAGEQTGGRPDRAPLLARAATAAGVHALFIECHPEPAQGLSDASTMLRLDAMPRLLRDVAAVRRAVTG